MYDGIIVVFDLSQPDCLTRLKKQLSILCKLSKNKKVPTLLVGNKFDESACINYTKLYDFVQKKYKSMKFIHASAKSGFNLHKIKSEFIEKEICRSRDLEDQDQNEDDLTFMREKKNRCIDCMN